MANAHSTETTLPELDCSLDITDELNDLHDAFESYHSLVSAYLLRYAEQNSDRENCARFINGLNTLFYSTLARSERAKKALQNLGVHN
ncbi:hypothetical protein QO021_31600 (plasmid) [Pseudomonas amygdali pv. lachrymans]|uniref:hypothetical protein n=1 Tax=Pseudomonas amygdali TaxID=47877 RepID=UPI000A5D4421|nr:hypothetical protein [Pseudomonas amygdali]RMM41109.1 hypothetical protein ALQ79_200721 [Pseudomonas amygdali pv. lachrymans]WIO61895.1 hypothetical protein QO021_31600 [Pseudomonas amygdali pv. lachrymans]